MNARTPLQRTVRVDDREVATDSEGYLRNLADWSEDFARALAGEEGLALTPEHWEVIRFLREYYQEHGVQAQVRVMIRHFTAHWDARRGSNHYLHELFPVGTAEAGQPACRAAADQGRTLKGARL